MSVRRRSRVKFTNAWSELRLRFDWPEQGSHELIRPEVLFGLSAAERDQQPLKTITVPRFLETRFQSPQMALWELGPEDWHLVLRLPEYAARRRRAAEGLQLSRSSRRRAR